MLTLLLLFLAGVIGGALNAVAGGGSFVTLPALLHAGITPVVANATSTFALWPASVSSIFAYRKDINVPAATLALLGGASLAGGLAGALLLIRTSDSSFMRLLPWLLLFASVTFTLSGRLSARIGRPAGGAHRFSAWAALIQFAIAVYGGYFGGGMGIMMLATLAIAGMTDIHEMNGLKSMLGAAINGIALAEFIRSGAVSWAPGSVMLLGAVAGGYGGASIARLIDRQKVRVLVIMVGWAMTAYFFLRQWRLI